MLHFLVGLKLEQKNVNSDNLMVPLWLLVSQRFSPYSSASWSCACLQTLRWNQLFLPHQHAYAREI